MYTREQVFDLMARERANHNPFRIREPADALSPLYAHRNRTQECFWALTLDGAHQLIKMHEITRGLVNRTIVHPREIFRPAIIDNAVAVILAHNHPSGSVEPSQEDCDITKRLANAGHQVGIRVLDHVIFSKTHYYSFLEQGLMD